MHVLTLVVVAAVVGAATGMLAAGILIVGGGDVESVSRFVRSWSVDDVFGLVCIAPAVLTLHRPTHWNWSRSTEYSAVVVGTAAATFYIFWVVVPGEQGLVGWPYVVILGPMWIAVRFGVAAVAPVLAVMFWLAAIQTVSGVGAFVSASATALDRVVALQLFAIVMSAAVLMLGGAARRPTAFAVPVERLGATAPRGGRWVRLADLREVLSAGVLPRGRYELVNRTWSRVTGLSDETTLGSSDAELFPPEIAREYLDHDEEVLSANAPVSVQERSDSVDAGRRIYASAKFPLRDEEGRTWGVGGIATDITGTVAARERELRSAELLRAVFEQSPTPAVRLAIDRSKEMRVFDANAAMCTLMGVPRGVVEKCDLLEHIHPDDVATAWDVLTDALAHDAPSPASDLRQRELRMRTEVGRTVWVLMSAAAVGDAGRGGETELVAQFEDFTARREAEEALSDQAMRDPVTGLPNRRALRERMQLALLRLRRHPGRVTVLFCDLDRFKDVNDSLGHHVGDQMLVSVAERLRSALRPEDMIARLGGDEFVAMGEGFADDVEAVAHARRLQDRLSAPWVHSEQVFRPAMSVGIATTSDPETSVDELLRRADLAMYRAKEGGRNRVEIYQRAVDEEIQQGVAFQHDLRLAIDTGQLILHYQPIVRLESLRWSRRRPWSGCAPAMANSSRQGCSSRRPRRPDSSCRWVRGSFDRRSPTCGTGGIAVATTLSP